MSTSSTSDNRVAIVSGATSGIGRAVAMQLADTGIAVTAFGNDAGQVEKLMTDNGRPELVAVAHADVTDEAALAVLVDGVLDRHGRIDILCNAAGIKVAADASETTLELWDRTQAVNVRGAFALTQLVLPTMVAQKSGVIINIGSPSSAGDPAAIAYGASKGALAALTATLAQANLANHIRVNLVVPGSTRTGMNEGRPEHIHATLGRSNVAGRVNEPSDVANAVSFLVSDAAATISGATLHVGTMPGQSVAAPPELDT